MVRDRIAEISEIKARRGRLHRLTILSRVERLEKDWNSAVPRPWHLVQFVPVALVTLVEVFLESFVSDLIDGGRPYLDNSERLLRDIKFDFRAIRAIEGKRVTVGEFVAHHLSFSTISDVENALSQIVGTGFFERLGQTVDRSKAGADPTKPIVTDLEAMKGLLVKLFRDRHIIIHEITDDPVIDESEVSGLITATKEFLSSTYWLAYDLLTPEAPLWQGDMNAKAQADLLEANTQVNALVDRLGAMYPESLAELTRIQAVWEEYRANESAFAAAGYAGGSIEALIRAAAAHEITEERLSRLAKYIEASSERQGDPRPG